MTSPGLSGDKKAGTLSSLEIISALGQFNIAFGLLLFPLIGCILIVWSPIGALRWLLMAAVILLYGAALSRCVRIRFVLNDEGFEVRNLFSTHKATWNEVRRVSSRGMITIWQGWDTFMPALYIETDQESFYVEAAYYTLGLTKMTAMLNYLEEKSALHGFVLAPKQDYLPFVRRSRSTSSSDAG